MVFSGVCPSFTGQPGSGSRRFAITGYSVGLIPLGKVCAAGLVDVEFEAFARWEVFRDRGGKNWCRGEDLNLP